MLLLTCCSIIHNLKLARVIFGWCNSFSIRVVDPAILYTILESLHRGFKCNKFLKKICQSSSVTSFKYEYKLSLNVLNPLHFSKCNLIEMVLLTCCSIIHDLKLARVIWLHDGCLIAFPSAVVSILQYLYTSFHCLCFVVSNAISFLKRFANLAGTSFEAAL